MSETSWDALRERFLINYDSFRERLRRRLGSDELAKETLHETWLQICRARDAKPILQPDSYLFGIALNMAAGLKRSEGRHASRVEIEAALEFAADIAGPDEIAEARFDLERLEQAIRELPARQRQILLAARIEETPIDAIASSLGLSRRSVEIDLKHAIEYCAKRLDRRVVKRFGPKPRNAT